MIEPLKRRSLIAVAPAEPPPAEAIAAVAARNGFPEAEARPPAPPPPVAQARPEPGQGSNRRRRQPIGRDHQFTTRLRQDTLDLIYTYANDRDIPIAQVIEEAMTALQAQRSKGA